MNIAEKIKENINRKRVENGYDIFIERYIRAPIKRFNNNKCYNLNDNLYLLDYNERMRFISILVKYGFYIKLETLYEKYSLFCRCRKQESVNQDEFVSILHKKLNCDMELLFDPNDNMKLEPYLVGVRYVNNV